MKRHLLALPLLLAALPSFAQNPPPAPAPPAPPAAPAPGAPPAPTPPVKGEVTLGYQSDEGQHGHREREHDVLAALDAHALVAQIRSRSANSASTDELRTAEAYAAKYKGKRPFDDSKSYLFTALDWSHDRFSAYEEQLSESAGYGRRADRSRQEHV